MSRGRTLSMAPVDANKGLKDVSQRNKSIKLSDKAQVKMGRAARKGEADRHIPGNSCLLLFTANTQSPLFVHQRANKIIIFLTMQISSRSICSAARGQEEQRTDDRRCFICVQFVFFLYAY